MLEELAENTQNWKPKVIPHPNKDLSVFFCFCFGVFFFLPFRGSDFLVLSAILPVSLPIGVCCTSPWGRVLKSTTEAWQQSPRLSKYWLYSLSLFWMEFFQRIVISVVFKLWVGSLNWDGLVKCAHIAVLSVKWACVSAPSLVPSCRLAPSIWHMFRVSFSSIDIQVGRGRRLPVPTLKAPPVEQELVCL